MFTLHIDTDCPRCGELAETLRREHLAHAVHEADASEDPGPHSLVDDGEVVREHEAMQRRIGQRTDLLRKTQRYPSDLCFLYPDDEASTCSGKYKSDSN